MASRCRTAADAAPPPIRARVEDLITLVIIKSDGNAYSITPFFHEDLVLFFVLKCNRFSLTKKKKKRKKEQQLTAQESN